MSFNNWTQTTWGEIAELKYGKGLKGYKENTEGVPVYGTNGHIGYTNKPLVNGPGIIIGRKGAYRGVHFSKTDFFVIDTAYYLKPLNENIDIEWAYYELLTKDINSLDSGSAIPSTKREDFYALPVKVPPLLVQKRIARVLRTLDDKNNLNQKIIKNLEQLIQTIFKQWFINFEFPNEIGEPYISNCGKMMESELGLIPLGWEVLDLDKITENISKGTTPTSKDIKEAKDVSSIRFIKVKDIEDSGSIKLNGLEMIPNSIHLNKLKRSILRENDILFSIAGTIGRVTYINKHLDNSNINQALAFIRLQEPEKHFNLVYYYLKSVLIQQDIKSKIVQGVQANVSLTVIKTTKIVMPSLEILERFNKVACSIFKKIEILNEQIHTLSSIRVTLLPKLLSGEIEIPIESEEEVHVQI
ncbi:restriction endonuclease subunit S [Bacillaceae bacterium C204]|uniref:restriction endonuclease subunit S n=1 Tax=Neobacillus sp. 204 TaxID=3383351 RepID=UPI00397A7D8F